MDFHSIYKCPVAVRRTAGMGLQGFCSMELLDIMTREGPITSEFIGSINDFPNGVDFILRQAVVSWNDEGSAQLSMTERADAIWPILPTLIDTKRAFGDYNFENSHAALLQALGDQGWTEYCCPECHVEYSPSKAWWDPVAEKADPVKATEVLKKTIEIFYQVANITPTQTDYTPQQVYNLGEWMDLHIGKGYQRDFPEKDGKPDFTVPYGESVSATAS